MKTVSVASFKQNLSRYLHMVAEGQELVVTSHQKPVARVISESDGIVIRSPLRPIATLRTIGGIANPAAPLAIEMLLEDRRRR